MAKRWYVVHAYSGFENQVARALKERIARASMEDKFGDILVPTVTDHIDANMLELTIGNTLLGVAQRILPREKNYRQEYGYGREILYNVMELMLEGVRNKDA